MDGRRSRGACSLARYSWTRSFRDRWSRARAGDGSHRSSMAGTRIRTARSAFSFGYSNLNKNDGGDPTRARTTSSRRRSTTDANRHPSRSGRRLVSGRRRGGSADAGGATARRRWRRRNHYAIDREACLHRHGPGDVQGRCRLDVELPGPDLVSSGAGEVHGLPTQLADGDGVGAAANFASSRAGLPAVVPPESRDLPCKPRLEHRSH